MPELGWVRHHVKLGDPAAGHDEAQDRDRLVPGAEQQPGPPLTTAGVAYAMNRAPSAARDRPPPWRRPVWAAAPGPGRRAVDPSMSVNKNVNVSTRTA
jgi:hypothetical protein